MRFLIIPCFNEAQRIKPDEIVNCIEVLRCEVILVDDGSTDETRHILNKFATDFPQHVEVLALPSNIGKGEAVRAGVNLAFSRGANQVLFCDADFAVGSADLLRICNELENYSECTAVIGSRIAIVGSSIERSVFRHYAGRAFATLVSLLLGHQIYDTQCGAKVFKVDNGVKRAFSQPFISRWGFDVELIGRILRLNKQSSDQKIIRELPLHNWKEVPGSKLNLFSQVRTVIELLKIRTALKNWQ